MGARRKTNEIVREAQKYASPAKIANVSDAGKTSLSLFLAKDGILACFVMSVAAILTTMHVD